MMSKRTVIGRVAKEVEKKFINQGAGHDWWHIYRVWQLAKRLSRKEGADLFIVELGALLHDIADWKFNGNDFTVGPRAARALLNKFRLPEETVGRVCDIVANVSFKGAGAKNGMRSLEGKVVQDADRLDALGAIGIARAFAYGGSADRVMHDPRTKPQRRQSQKQYVRSKSTSINHFYEKLLLLSDLMNTETGKRIAAARHRFIENYLNEFFAEWEGRI